MFRVTDLKLWPLRVLWVLLGLIGGVPASDALDSRSAAVAVVLSTIALAGWSAALVAMLVPRTVSLTVVRTIVPAGWVAALAAVAAGDQVGALDVVALVVATAAMLFALAPWVTDAFVDGSSYGPEQRLSLRTPPAITAVAIVTWILVVAGATVGPLLLASRQWAGGAVATAAGAGLVRLGVRSLHGLSRRWIVLVPTGMVLHDSLVMPEPQLFLRQTMAHLGPAASDADGVTEDLSAGASGLVMELVVNEPVELLVRSGRDNTTLRAVDRVLFTPARPAALLDGARARRMPVS